MTVYSFPDEADRSHLDGDREEVGAFHEEDAPNKDHYHIDENMPAAPLDDSDPTRLKDFGSVSEASSSSPSVSEPNGQQENTWDEEELEGHQARANISPNVQGFIAHPPEIGEEENSTSAPLTLEAALEKLLLDRQAGCISREQYRAQKNTLIKKLRQDSGERPQTPSRQDIRQAAQVPTPTVKQHPEIKSAKQLSVRVSPAHASTPTPEPAPRLLPTYGFDHVWGAGILLGACILILATVLWLNTPLG